MTPNNIEILSGTLYFNNEPIIKLDKDDLICKAVIDKLCEPIGYIVTAEELTEILEKEN